MCASSNVCINVSCSMFKCRKKINIQIYNTYWNLEHNSIEMKNLASFVRNILHLSFETVTN